MSENSKMNWATEKLVPAIAKFTNLKFVRCMQAGITACMPATIIGSIFMLLMNVPFAADSTFGLAVAWRNFSQANGTWLNLGYQIGLNAAQGFFPKLHKNCLLSSPAQRLNGNSPTATE